RQPLGSATPLKRGETPRTGFKPKSDESPLTPSGAFFGSATPLARQPRGTATPLVKRFSSPNLVSGSESEELVSMTCTPTYAAPEVMIGFETKNTELFTPAVDVYSLGVSILEKLKDINDVGTQENIEEILVSLYNTFFVSDFEYRNAVSGQIANWCERSIVIPGDEAGSKFIGLLLSDCLAFNPEDRISAAQAAEILQVFSSYLEAKETNPGLKCPNYRVVKATAIKDSPKGIPIAIRKMLYDADPNMQQEAISIIENLVRADASYTNTPSYGLALLLKKPSRTPSDITFEDWAKDKRNFNSAKQLRERAYIREKDHSKEQDIPVSEEIYEIITSTIDLSDFEPEIDPSEPNSDSDSNVPNRTDQPNVSSARPRVPEKRNTI
ncbi:MAG: protein kinase domain-containing protein, partial [bacterium]